MALKEQDVVLYSTDADGNKVIQMPITRVENVEGALKTVGGVAPDENGNVTVTHPVTSVNGMTGVVTINVPPTPKAYVTETYHSGASWYRVYSDGFIEQGGYLTTSSNGSSNTVTLPKAMTSTNYTVTLGQTSAKDTWSTNVSSRTTTQITIAKCYSPGVLWMVSGY